MMDKTFAKWWLGRVGPYRDVPQEKLAAEREAMSRQQDYNRNYADFLNNAVLPAVDLLVQLLGKNAIVHRVSTWGNQLSLRVHLAWRWGELVITQSHEDAVTTRPRTTPTNTTCATPCPLRSSPQNYSFS